MKATKFIAHARVGYSHSCLLTMYRTTAPSFGVQQRLHELDLWAVSRLSCHHLSSTVCLRRYRSCRAGRSRRSVPRMKTIGNGAYIVTVPRPSTRLCPTSRRHCCQLATLIDVRTILPPIASTGRLTFSFLNVCSLTNKVDDMLELRRDRHIDVMCLAETWHDTDSVAFRRLRSAGYQVVDRPRPRPPSELPTMLTNDGAVAVVSVSGVRLSSIALSVDPTSF